MDIDKLFQGALAVLTVIAVALMLSFVMMIITFAVS